MTEGKSFGRRESVARRKATSAATGEMFVLAVCQGSATLLRQLSAFSTSVELSATVGSERSRATMQGKKGEACKAVM
jgi:hypothetical protein